MVTVPFSRQEIVNMARRAGLRDAAGEATRDLPGTVDLDQAEARGHGTAAPETISPAAWAAAPAWATRPAMIIRLWVTGRTGRGRSRRPPARRPTLDTQTGWYEMPTATQITCTQHDRNGVRCQALFSSALQPSDTPTPDMVATAISRAIQQFGIGGCTSRMAQEFGDHPDAAATRMRWLRQLIAPRPATQRRKEAA